MLEKDIGKKLFKKHLEHLAVQWCIGKLNKYQAKRNHGIQHYGYNPTNMAGKHPLHP